MAAKPSYSHAGENLATLWYEVEDSREIGKPEHLKYFGGNVWSRRLSGADRLVYEDFNDRIDFRQARCHHD